MTHFTNRLPRQVELGAVRTDAYEVEVVETDGGYEVRNLRHTHNKRTFEVSFPTAVRSDSVYQQILALYALVKGRLHSFDFVDWTDETGGTIIPVRFDSDLKLTGIDIHHDHIETLNLIEVFL